MNVALDTIYKPSPCRGHHTTNPSRGNIIYFGAICILNTDTQNNKTLWLFRVSSLYNYCILYDSTRKKKHIYIYIYLYIHEHTHVAQFKILKVATDKLMIWLIVFILLCCSVCATGQVDDHLFILLLITGPHVTSELLLWWVLVFQNNG